jgi:tRNA modification GTPase
MEADTIVAVATPPGRGGLGVIRLSGPESLAIAQRLFPGVKRWLDRHVTYGIVRDQEGNKLDEALVTYMRGPHTYTGEDVVEISCHGNPLILDRVVATVLAYGCRAARPGEFTLRAYLAGRIDLAQAEAVLDLVHASTEAGLGLALQQLGGTLSRKVEPLREQLLDVLAHATALVDFSEEDIPPLASTSIQADLEAVDTVIVEMLRSSRQGIVLRHGVSLVIVGSPNVGKSSMLNALLGRERAIVTPIAGTTRDTLEEQLDLGGILFHVIDTAGITVTNDPIERIGVERSQAALSTADMILFVLDRSRPLLESDYAIAKHITAVADKRTVIVALNKADLPAQLSRVDVPAELMPAAILETSVVDPHGLDALRTQLPLLALDGSPSDGFVVSNERHIQSLQEAHAALQRALEALATDLPLDLVTFDIRAAAEALGAITGANVNEELLDRIFSRFCIGK